MYNSLIYFQDMTIPGAPMVFVNQEFCRTTGYAREEATGRNCRFLQGPDTEPEAIQVIRNTLSKGQDCHVKLTNYRKNGEKFQNLLSMKPVFDADGIYRFVIGVQFEVKEDQNLKQRLVQLDKLLRLLPSKLSLRSKASARAKGALAVKVTGEANQYVNAKEQILQQAKQMEQQEAAAGQSRPKEIVQTNQYDPRSLNYDMTVVAFTKIMWLQDPINSCRALLLIPECIQTFLGYADIHCSELVKTHLRFVMKANKIRTAPQDQQLRKILLLHSKYDKNELFYCTTNRIQDKTMRGVNWGPIFEQLVLWQEQSTFMFAQEAFPKFLEHPSSQEMILLLRRRESGGENLPIKTVAKGLNPVAETFWLDMFRAMSESVTIGCVISDMTVPGIPLVHINEGFKAVTGYGKEKIGTSCRFLQGKETESYLNDEIMAALQQSERLIVKLHNYKANQQKFQCLFALHPVFGPAPDHEYKYQIGLQIDFNNSDPELPKKLVELGRVLRYLPQCVSGEKMTPVDQTYQEMQAFINSGGASAAGAGMGGMGGGGFGGGGMGGFGAAPPMGAPPSFASPRKNSFSTGGGGLFGASPAPAMGGFGASPAPAMGGFGASPAPAMGGFGAPAMGGGFGGPAPAMGGFGAPAMGGGFGASPAPTMGGFGAPAMGGFGSTPAPGGFGGMF
jgi:PAS domain S-box-containing protein